MLFLSLFGQRCAMYFSQSLDFLVWLIRKRRMYFSARWVRRIECGSTEGRWYSCVKVHEKLSCLVIVHIYAMIWCPNISLACCKFILSDEFLSPSVQVGSFSNATIPASSFLKFETIYDQPLRSILFAHGLIQLDRK